MNIERSVSTALRRDKQMHNAEEHWEGTMEHIHTHTTHAHTTHEYLLTDGGILGQFGRSMLDGRGIFVVFGNLFLECLRS